VEPNNGTNGISSPKSAALHTATTPSTFAAALVSTPTSRPWATVLRTNATSRQSGMSMSPT
jgi:hypothetical protein